MFVRILNPDDYAAVEKIYHSNFEAVSQRQFLKTGNHYEKDSVYMKITEMWFSALNKYYLDSADQDHILLGLFDQDYLLAYVGIRFDLPAGFENDWVVSYLKADPDVNIINNKGMQLLWIEMFKYAESRNKSRWHTITEVKRHRAFDAFGIKMVPEINNRYEFFTMEEIPAGTRSQYDWVFAMMGKMIHYDKDYMLRTGVLKHSVA
jgi:hypothetical protein